MKIIKKKFSGIILWVLSLFNFTEFSHGKKNTRTEFYVAAITSLIRFLKTAPSLDYVNIILHLLHGDTGKAKQ